MSQVGSVALVTVAFNSDQALQTLVASWNTNQPNGTVVVVDNAPTASEWLASAPPQVQAIFRPDNPGYGGAINAAVAALPASVESILICNPDVELSPGSVERLVESLREQPGVAAVGPRIVDETGATYPSARAVPSLGIGVGHALLHHVWPRNPWTRAYHARNEATAARPCGWLSGACLLVRRRAFESIGGFDERYFMYFEDVDLGYRLGLAGWINWYEPSVSVVHTGAHSTRNLARVMRAAHHESAKRFIRARYPHWWQAPLRGFVTWALEARKRLGR
ncbi:MAG TPA: glycosyltransferase family 2 protein [Microbacteriaceae bacterium]|nr:glycosyltransferase family 2 protein [Microbacteriaceae bacterium]